MGRTYHKKLALVRYEKKLYIYVLYKSKTLIPISTWVGWNRFLLFHMNILIRFCVF